MDMHRILIICALAAFSGCGGSGGTERESSVIPQGVTLSPNAVESTLPLRDQGYVYRITAAPNNGEDLYSLHFKADVDPHLFSGVKRYKQADDSVVIEMRTHRGLWSSEYSGEATFYFCEDAECNQPIAGSPISLRYTIGFPKSQIRMEPLTSEIIEQPSSVVSFGKDYAAVYVEADGQTVPNVAVPVLAEYPTEFGKLVFPEETLESIQITDVSEQGFTFITPEIERNSYAATNGMRTFSYEFGFTNSDKKFNYKIYHIEDSGRASSDQYIFLDNPIEINATYSHSFTIEAPYIYIGDDSGLGQPVNTSIQFEGTAFSSSIYNSGRSIWAELHPPLDQDLGVFTGGLTFSNYSGDSMGSARISLNVSHGFVEVGPFSSIDDWSGTFSFTQEEFPLQGGYYYVLNSNDAQGNWSAETQASWLKLLSSNGSYGEGENKLAFTVDAEEFSLLPNNSRNIAEIALISEGGQFEDKTIALTVDKLLPQITAISTIGVEAGRPFSLDVEGYNLKASKPCVLSTSDESLICDLFNVDVMTATDSYMRLSHAGIEQPGIYEIIFDYPGNSEAEYRTEFVPRLAITVSSP